jgi:hypothetical protein
MTVNPEGTTAEPSLEPQSASPLAQPVPPGTPARSVYQNREFCRPLPGKPLRLSRASQQAA